MCLIPGIPLARGGVSSRHRQEGPRPSPSPRRVPGSGDQKTPQLCYFSLSPRSSTDPLGGHQHTHTHTHTPTGTDDSHWRSPRQTGGGLLHGDLTAAGPPGQSQQSWAVTWGLAFQGLQRPVAGPATWAPPRRPLAQPLCGALTLWPSVPGPPAAGLPSLSEFPPGLPGSLSSLLKRRRK